MVTFTYYGHACFQDDDGKYKLLTNQFIPGNPRSALKAE